jgi:polyisoprenoid-binding protein YceI
MKFILLSLIAAWTVSTTPIDKKPVDIAKSTITWVGKKVTGQHTGTINIKEGALEFDNGILTGGTFIIDMTSLTVTDLQGGMADKLKGHLTSDDFFGIATYPEAKLVITTVNADGNKYMVTGDLTIKGKTAPINFTTTINGNMATADIVVDRTVYDVKYGSGKFFEGLGDKMIYDDFNLSIGLAF